MMGKRAYFLPDWARLAKFGPSEAIRALQSLAGSLYIPQTCFNWISVLGIVFCQCPHLGEETAMNPVFTMMALQAAPAAPAPNVFLQLMPFILIFVIFYFLLIRPQQQARKRHEEMVNAVRRGDKVVTAGGILGKVVKAGDGAEIEVELADGVVVTVIKQTLTDVKSKNQPVEPEKK